MLHNTPAVFGIYTSRRDVERAIEQFQKDDFARTDISVFVPNPADVHVPDTKAVEGAEMGMTAGALVGAVLGWLAGVGMLAIPGIGAVIVAGPLATTLIAAGAAAGIGGLWGGLIGLGIPEKEAKLYQSRLHKGDILLSVHCADHDKIAKAKEIMVDTNAEDVYSRTPMTRPVHVGAAY